MAYQVDPDCDELNDFASAFTSLGASPTRGMMVVVSHAGIDEDYFYIRRAADHKVAHSWNSKNGRVCQ